MHKKPFLLFVFILIFTISCKTSITQKSHDEVISEYISALNNGNFQKIKDIVTDSIITTEVDYIVTSGIDELKVNFKWDSVFKPNYKLIEFHSNDNRAETIISKNCTRIEFLQDSATICKMNFIFNGSRISKIETVDFVFLDFDTWESRKKMLVDWIDKNNPELSGFIYDMTPRGAQNYLKAIELFENENSN